MARNRASRPGAKPLRLFVAIDVPEEVRSLISDAASPLRERFPKGRWVPEENWHVTLKFLGATWPRLVEWVSSEVGEAASGAGSFRTRVEGLGAFPSAWRARVLWAGLEDPGGAMARLAETLDEALAREFAPEKRAFTAHLTVARFDPAVELGEDVGAARLRSEPFAVDRLVLYRSHLRRPAPVYEPVARFPLGAG